jgi:hypothetical protein
MMAAKTGAAFTPRATSPIEKISHPKGLIIAKIAIVSKRTIAAASFHFGTRRTKTKSSEKRAQAIVMGTVSPRTREKPFRK